MTTDDYRTSSSSAHDQPAHDQPAYDQQMEPDPRPLQDPSAYEQTGASTYQDERPSTVEDRPVDSTPKLVTDKVVGAFGLVVLRLVVAVIMGVHGFQKFQQLDATKQFYASTPIFAPEAMATVTAIGELAVAVALLLGVLVRVAGLGVVAIAVGALVYVKWQVPLFTDGTSGFSGELELLLAAAGLVLVSLGGGAWGVDRWFRSRHKRGAAALRR